MHVSGMQASLQGAAASKVIVSIGETNKNLKGMINKYLCWWFIVCLWVHDALVCLMGFLFVV